jgi:23S rRNA (guanine745-N1)-methyltransferase
VLEDRREVVWRRSLRRREVAALVASGPNAWHTDTADLERHLDELPEPIEVTFAVTVSTYRR